MHHPRGGARPQALRPAALNRCEKQQRGRTLGAPRAAGDIGELLDELSATGGFCGGLSTFEAGLESLVVLDAFLGFTEDTLPSLLVREILQAEQEPDAAAALALQADTVDLMSADAVARAELSKFAQDAENEEELRELVTRYYTQRYHAGLGDCLSHFFPKFVGFRDGRQRMAVDDVPAGPERLLVLTFTSWQSDVQKLLAEPGVGTTNFGRLHLVQFASEARLREDINKFWQ